MHAAAYFSHSALDLGLLLVLCLAEVVDLLEKSFLPGQLEGRDRLLVTLEAHVLLAQLCEFGLELGESIAVCDVLAFVFV